MASENANAENGSTVVVGAIATHGRFMMVPASEDDTDTGDVDYGVPTTIRPPMPDNGQVYLGLYPGTEGVYHSAVCIEHQKRLLAWEDAHPNHCKACGGVGTLVKTISETVDEFDPHSVVFVPPGEEDACLECVVAGKCPRCSASLHEGIAFAGQILKADLVINPCLECGWSWDSQIYGPPFQEPTDFVNHYKLVVKNPDPDFAIGFSCFCQGGVISASPVV